MHPEDWAVVQADPQRYLHRYVNWDLAEAMEYHAALPGDTVLHVGLHPQPFIGNVDDPLVFILLGNPGFAFHDYLDEFENAAHSAACANNLNDDTGFFPLAEASANTGAQAYWQSVLLPVIAGLSNQTGRAVPDAQEFVMGNVGVVESCAYHSARTPGLWTDCLPSSAIARAHVQNVVFPRAQAGDSFVFVWRRVRFWGLNDDTQPNVLMRDPQQAQHRTLLKPELEAIAGFLSLHA